MPSAAGDKFFYVYHGTVYAMVAEDIHRWDDESIFLIKVTRNYLIILIRSSNP